MADENWFRAARSLRGISAQLLLAAFVLHNAHTLRLRTADQVSLLRQATGADPVTADDADLARVAAYLPVSGTIGYLQSDFQRGNLNDLAGLFRAQYSLAPRLVVPEVMPEFLIAAARPGGLLPDVPAGYAMAHLFSARLALYRRVR